MTRIGINPARGKTTSYRPARVTAAVLTYLPSLDGYFAHRLETLRLSLASLMSHTSRSHDLFIFDNGSCDRVVDYLLSLRRAGLVDNLLLSPRNLGKIDALRILFGAAPGELIAYSDDDIFFYPGWLEAHLQILESFPRAGMVSGAPVRNAAGHANQSLEQLAVQGAPHLSVRRERRIPDAWETDWALSTGRDPQEHLRETQSQLDLVFELKSPDEAAVEAIGSANHFQFVSPKALILQALPEDWTGKLMGSMLELDEAVDNLGYLRLSTVQRYTRHLGNHLSAEMQGEAARYGLLQDASAASTVQRPIRRKHWLLRLPGARRALQSVYRRLFDVLYN